MGLIPDRSGARSIGKNHDSEYSENAYSLNVVNVYGQGATGQRQRSAARCTVNAQSTFLISELFGAPAAPLSTSGLRRVFVYSAFQGGWLSNIARNMQASVD